MPPVLPTETIARLSYGRKLLRCGISTRLMSARGLGRFKTFRQKRFKLRETVNEPFFDFDYARIAAISG
jgi:hypothetical protein